MSVDKNIYLTNVRLVNKFNNYQFGGKKIDPLKLLFRFIFGKLRTVVGGNLRVLLSGGAPLAPDAHEYCRTVLGISLLQVGS